MHDRGILITGATGLVGESIRSMLSSSEGPRYLLSRRSSMTLRPREIHISGDTSTLHSLRDPFEVDAIVHAAGRVSGASYAEYEENVDLAADVARYALNQEVPLLVVVSSAGVYGSPASGSFDESAQTNPSPGYELSKLRGEAVINRMLAKSKTRVACLRPTSLYSDTFAGALAHYARIQSATGRLTSVNSIANILHVDDLAQAVNVCLSQDLAGTYNVSNDTPLATLFQQTASRPLHRLPGAAAQLLANSAQVGASLSSLLDLPAAAKRMSGITTLLGSAEFPSDRLKAQSWSPRPHEERSLIRQLFSANAHE